MRLTRVRDLAAIALVVWFVVWGVLRLLDETRGALPPMPRSVPVVLATFAASIALSAISLRRRLRGGRDVKPVHPLAAARMVALAKSTAYGGALLVGVYSGLALFLLIGDTSDLRRGRGFTAVAAAIACVGLSAAGLFLEHVCRVDPPPDEPGGAGLA